VNISKFAVIASYCVCVPLFVAKPKSRIESDGGAMHSKFESVRVRFTELQLIIEPLIFFSGAYVD